MERDEMISRLMAKMNVSKEEAERALDACNGDILDALDLLERQKDAGEKAEPKSEYSTQDKSVYDLRVTQEKRGQAEGSGSLHQVWAYLKALIRKGNRNQVVITRNGQDLLAVPMTVMILLLIISWPWSLIVGLISLFFGIRFALQGPDISKKVQDAVSGAQEKAASAIEIRTKNENDQNRE